MSNEKVKFTSCCSAEILAEKCTTELIDIIKKNIKIDDDELKKIIYNIIKRVITKTEDRYNSDNPYF
ncbi:MAG: hypothetical protein WC934_02955 [Acidithiobacillus sp.]|jgi:hypothetical protein|uniref:hypothetical protein n=1 Tax=Acidithiobacillus sp. TaxID=1872118 RepID=UPI00355F136C